MRIALVIGTLQIGGTENQLCRLAMELQARGHTVKVFVLSRGGPLADYLGDASVPFEIFGFEGIAFRNTQRQLSPSELLRCLGGLRSFWQALWHFQSEVCHAFLPTAYMFALPGAALGRVPVRIAARRSLASELRPRPHERAIQRLSVGLAHAIVANSEAVADDVETVEGISESRLHVIPNGVDGHDNRSDVARTPAVGLMVANFIAYKGHDDLVRAMQLLDDPPLVRLVGDGPERERLEALVSTTGLSGVVRFAGSVPSASALFADVQFGVLASHHEGMPSAVLEAMSYGVPVVATAVGGVTELIEDRVSGLLVAPHRPRALGAAIAHLCSDPSLRVRLGSAGRERARLLTWARCVEAHEHLYADLLVRRTGRIGFAPTTGSREELSRSPWSPAARGPTP